MGLLLYKTNFLWLQFLCKRAKHIGISWKVENSSQDKSESLIIVFYVMKREKEKQSMTHTIEQVYKV